jgi:VCBS repeat-containing protein
MAKLIRVWDGTTWQEVATAIPNALTIDGNQTLTNKTISGLNNTLSNIENASLTNSSITINGSAVSLGGSVSIPTGPTAQAVSSNITMVANYNYFVDTTVARTLTLPASPTLGDTIAIYDASGTAATNNITISRNGNKINGQTEDAIIDVNQASSTFVYTGATVGWRFD